MKKKVSVSWSGGKDSALALYKIMQGDQYEVVNLHTSFNNELRRVGMHGTPESLIEAQVEMIGIPLEKIYISADSTNESYENAMLGYYFQLKQQGIDTIMFGDIFLEDLKAYRERLLSLAGMKAIYPLWKQDTKQLIQEFLNSGFKTCICAADAKFFDETTVGKVIDKGFIENLPAEVDPCGERGEFHTFVFDGPLFKKAVAFERGETVLKKYALSSTTSENLGFWFIDLKVEN